MKVVEYVSGDQIPIDDTKHIWVTMPSKLKLCEHDSKPVLKRSDYSSGNGYC